MVEMVLKTGAEMRESAFSVSYQPLQNKTLLLNNYLLDFEN